MILNLTIHAPHDEIYSFANETDFSELISKTIDSFSKSDSYNDNVVFMGPDGNCVGALGLIREPSDDFSIDLQEQDEENEPASPPEKPAPVIERHRPVFKTRDKPDIVYDPNNNREELQKMFPDVMED